MVLSMFLFLFILNLRSDTKSGIPDTRDNIFVGEKREDENKEKKK